MGLFDDTPAVKDEPKPETSAAFTDEQDKTLMEMKTSNNTWAEIATKLGKDTDECKTRFKVIKPAGWKPDEKGGNQKKEQNKGGNKGKGQGKQSGVKEKKDGKASTNGNGNTGSYITSTQFLTILQATITGLPVTTVKITWQVSTCGGVLDKLQTTLKQTQTLVQAEEHGVPTNGLAQTMVASIKPGTKEMAETTHGKKVLERKIGRRQTAQPTQEIPVVVRHMVPCLGIP